MAPWLAVMKSSDGAPLVNLYEDLTAEMDLSSGVSLRLAISGGFPRAGELKISVSPSKPARFAIRLRIPAWSENSSARVGADSYPAKAGSYLEIVREWKTGDLIELSLDMRVRVIDAFDASRRMAVMRGPVVLAQDSRLGAVDAPVSGKDAWSRSSKPPRREFSIAIAWRRLPPLRLFLRGQRVRRARFALRLASQEGLTPDFASIAPAPVPLGKGRGVYFSNRN
jgi:hypothetical protein